MKIIKLKSNHFGQNMYPGFFCVILIFAPAISAVPGVPTVESEEKIEPPIADVISHQIHRHGKTVEDEYAWLRDKNWPKVTDSKILDYIKAENAYADKFFAPLQSKHDVLFEELKAWVKLDDISPYEERDGWLYYEKTMGEKQYPIYCRKKGSADAAEEVLLDVNIISEGQKYTDVNGVIVSPNHDYLAYVVDHEGNEKFIVKILDLNTRNYLPDEIKDVGLPIHWHEKIPGIFYHPLNENQRKDKICFHRLNTNTEDDKFVFGITDNIFMLRSALSSSRKYIFINIFGYSKNKIYALDITSEKDDFPVVLIKDFLPEGITYEVTHAGENFYLRTNFGAENFRVVVAPETNPSDWSNTYVNEDESYLRKIASTEKYLVMTYKVDGLNVIKLKRFADGTVKSINFPDASYFTMCYDVNYKLNEIQIEYSSLRRPETIYKYDYDSEELTVIKHPYSRPNFDSDEYVVEYITAPSSNNKEEVVVSIPATILYKKSLFRSDGTNPLYLYGYGAYGMSVSGYFRSQVIPLVDRGFVYVIANVRGGDERGTHWYESAKFLNKKRTFQDFIAVAETLISRGYTSAGNIVASGRSAGGMLIGAVLNDRPDLFKAAVANVPFVDVLNTTLDESLPLTPLEFKEWGNPITDAQYFDYIKSYCPYTNLQKQDYPYIFFRAAISDTRVAYWEPLKYVARLRKLKTDDNILLLKTEMDSGHMSSTGRFDYLKEYVEELLFIFQIAFHVEI